MNQVIPIQVWLNDNESIFQTPFGYLNNNLTLPYRGAFKAKAFQDEKAVYLSSRLLSKTSKSNWKT